MGQLKKGDSFATVRTPCDCYCEKCMTDEEKSLLYNGLFNNIKELLGEVTAKHIAISLEWPININ